MCGICGIRRFGDKPIDAGMFNILLTENQKRGNHATGVAIQQADGSIDVFKKDEPAWTMQVMPEYKRFINEYLRDDSRTILGHTRWATQGSPTKNENNHPLFSGTTAVTHNGHINNDTSMFTSLKLTRRADTDTDIIRAIFDEYGFNSKAINHLNKLYGSAAIAAVSSDYPGKLFLGRSGNPIMLASSDEMMIWSSEISPILRCARPFQKKFGMFFRKVKADLGTASMFDNQAYIFSDTPDKGGGYIIHRQELKIATHFTPKVYEVDKGYFGSRVRFYDHRPAQVVLCRNKKCNSWVSVNPIQARRLDKIECSACKTKLKA